MKNIYHRIKSLLSKRATQDELIEFISNKDNLHKAVEGSMQKRIDLFERIRVAKKGA